MKNSVFSLFVLVIFTLLFSSCSNIENVPPGYKAKILTPTGWQKGIINAGQVDIGKLTSNGTGNSLVLLEATTITIKESFMKSNDDNEDHRVRTKDGTPLTVDIYVQVALPVEDKTLDEAFASVTPKPNPADKRVYSVTLEDIYTRFAKMTVRGKVREIFARYKDADAVMGDYGKVNAEIGVMALDVFEKSGAPCQLISAQLSNVKEDEDVLKSKNENIAAQNQAKSIEQIGEALRRNPEYATFMKWQTLKDMAGKGVSIYVIDGEKGPVLTLPAR